MVSIMLCLISFIYEAKNSLEWLAIPLLQNQLLGIGPAISSSPLAAGVFLPAECLEGIRITCTPIQVLGTRVE